MTGKRNNHAAEKASKAAISCCSWRFWVVGQDLPLFPDTDGLYHRIGVAAGILEVPVAGPSEAQL